MANFPSFLGKGWSFPPTFNKYTQDVELIVDEEDIDSSLHILLSTRLGERVMLPDYGCNLDELIFNPLTTTLKTYVKDLIKTAILYHEPRIDIDSIDIVETSEIGMLEVSVVYTIRTTNTRYNFVYPFYINEGTNV